jgi:hypothetical protein
MQFYNSRLITLGKTLLTIVPFSLTSQNLIVETRLSRKFHRLNQNFQQKS